MRIWHLLTHTSGLTYGFHHAHPVDAHVPRRRASSGARPPGSTSPAAATRWAALPLLFQPGTEWNYSVSTDVLGRVVEVVSGQPLDEFFAERIFEPLGMTDTGFSAPEADHDRLAALYVPGPGPAGRAASTPWDAAHAAAGVPVGRRRAGVDRGRLPPLHPDAARRRRARRRAAARHAHGRAT